MISRIPLDADLYRLHAKAVEEAVQLAVNDALLDHKRAGNPIATWRDGKVVILQPHEIPVDDDSNGSNDNPT